MPTNLRGIVTMFAAVAAFSVLDVTMKRLVEVYPVMQVTFMRGAASLPFLVGATVLFGRWSDLKPRRWSLHLVRGFLSVATLWFFVYAVSLLSLADAYAIFMSAPLLITALSGPVLGEHVGWHRWLAVLVGLAGVIIVLRPTGASLGTIGGLAAIAAAIGYALSVLTIRILSRTDTSAATVMWSLLLLTIISGLLAVAGWRPVYWEHWGWIAGMGLSGALGQYLITEAFRRAPAPVIAPLEYTALAWGMLFDWMLWMTLPSARMLVGAAIIVASGLYVIQRERLAGAVPASAGH
jgi:drug/metabolite transporter (DMT)-like permease